MKGIDVIDEASEVVANCLTLVQMKSEVQELLTSRSSRYICRCPNCRSRLRATQAWLRDMRSAATPEAA